MVRAYHRPGPCATWQTGPYPLAKGRLRCHTTNINERQEMINLNTRYSDCASKVSVNPLTGTAKVTFRNGYGPYRFTRLSRRMLAQAALTELIGGQISVGEFINRKFWA